MTATEFDPAALGLPRAPSTTCAAATRRTTRTVSRAVLAGETGPVRDIVLLNAAAAMTPPRRGGDSGVTSSDELAKALGDGLARAAAAVDSGAAADLLDRWTQASNRLATPRPRASSP